MKSIRTLLKWYDKQLDEKRRQIASFRGQQEQLRRYRKEMQDQMVAEQKVAQENPELAALVFENFCRLIDKRQATITYSLQDLDRQIALTQEEIAETFREAKKFEVLLQQHLVKERQELKRKEDKEIDEVAIQNYIKQQEGAMEG